MRLGRGRQSVWLGQILTHVYRVIADLIRFALHIMQADLVFLIPAEEPFDEQVMFLFLHEVSLSPHLAVAVVTSLICSHREIVDDFFDVYADVSKLVQYIFVLCELIVRQVTE